MALRGALKIAVPGKVNFSGTPKSGEVVTLQLGGTDYSYTTKSTDTLRTFVTNFAQVINGLLAKSGLESPPAELIELEGRGAAGTARPAAAAALLATALFWKQFKLLSFDPAFAAGLGVPVRVENDANAAAYGAWRERGGGLCHFTGALHGRALDLGTVFAPRDLPPSARTVHLAQLGRVLRLQLHCSGRAVTQNPLTSLSADVLVPEAGFVRSDDLHLSTNSARAQLAMSAPQAPKYCQSQGVHELTLRRSRRLVLGGWCMITTAQRWRRARLLRPRRTHRSGQSRTGC